MKGKAKKMLDKYMMEVYPGKAKLVNGEYLAYSFDGSLSQMVYWDELPDIFKFSILEDFFDSIGIVIGVFKVDSSKSFTIGVYGEREEEDNYGYIIPNLKTRKEARMQGIKSALSILEKREDEKA